jgi:hypothetical protein
VAEFQPEGGPVDPPFTVQLQRILQKHNKNTSKKYLISIITKKRRNSNPF